MKGWKFIDHQLQFKVESGTSRGILTQKYSGFVYTQLKGETIAIGEVSTIPGLSIDHMADFNSILHAHILEGIPEAFPALIFGVEMWKLSSASPNPYSLFPSTFSSGEMGIPINGLIWMGTKEDMLSQIKEKLNAGFTCVKLKIGAIEFQDELELLKHIRNEYDADEVEIRLDANGAFSPNEAMEKLKRLSEYDIHSIEQPIKKGQWEQMAVLCGSEIIDIALDEELIGVYEDSRREEMLTIIKPQYIILKPSLIGGFGNADKWIDLVSQQGIGWWATSALESNIGLNAIAQWVSRKGNEMPQGLGTGSLFSNNVMSPLEIRNAKLWYNSDVDWNLSNLGIEDTPIG